MDTGLELPIRLRASPSWYFWTGIALIAFFLIPGLMFVLGLNAPRPAHEDPRLIPAFGYLLIVFGAIAGAAYYAISLRRPTVLLTDEGIHHPLFTKGLVPWAQLANAYFCNPLLGAPYIGVSTSNKKMLTLMSSMISFIAVSGDIFIVPAIYGIPAPDLLSLINRQIANANAGKL